MEEVRRLMELNFFALLGLTQLVAPHMRARRSGTIVNVGSIGGKIVLPWMTLYSASKYAVGALTEGLRMELRRDGVRTMLVCPGYVQDRFQQHAMRRRAAGEWCAAGASPSPPRSAPRPSAAAWSATPAR